jgi:hypothetical protein
MFLCRSKHTPSQNGASNRCNGFAPTHLIELRHVVKIYERAAGRFTALQDIDLQVDNSRTGKYWEAARSGWRGAF